MCTPSGAEQYGGDGGEADARLWEAKDLPGEMRHADGDIGPLDVIEHADLRAAS